MAEPTVGSPLSMHDPRTVGPWQVHSRLGAGGMGVVFYASSGDQHAAVKVIRPGLLDTPATRDRFRREVQILSRLRDQHICRYLDAELETEPTWLALEYLAGPVLRDEVAHNGPLDDATWWELAAGLAQALSVLAANRVTHRDLKPGNVILSERGAVLIDFGIANPEDATSLTATGLVTGSPAWLAPEQANLEPTGPATDIFTLGSLLAFAATGRPPFGEGASVAVLMAIIKRDPDLAGMDPIRAQFVRDLLDKDPAKRPTAQQVLESARAGAEGTLALRPEPDATVIAPPRKQASADKSRRAAGPAKARGPHTTREAPAPAAGAPPGTPAPPPPRTTGPRAVGPRTAAAQRRRAARRRTILAVVAIALTVLLGWLLIRDSGPLSDGSPQPNGSVSAPSAPGSDQLRDDPWLLESYRLDNTDEGMVVSGTVRNTGPETASADLTVWLYADSEPLGSVGTTLTDIAPGAAVPVNMRGDAQWQPGTKTVLLQAP
jgi:serine/threonine protein kinase